MAAPFWRVVPDLSAGYNPQDLKRVTVAQPNSPQYLKKLLDSRFFLVGNLLSSNRGWRRLSPGQCRTVVRLDESDNVWVFGNEEAVDLALEALLVAGVCGARK